MAAKELMDCPPRKDSEFHRYRIAVIATWPDGPDKQAALRAAEAALDRELRYEEALRGPRRDDRK